MRSKQSSLTAAGIAIVRAVESEKPADERICNDPFARQFVNPWFFTFTRFFIDSGYAEWRGPGVNGFIVARERYIDDALTRFLQDGLEQLVILGAGFDSRAYRRPGLPGKVKIFEVDHPATQSEKLSRLQKICGAVPDYVIYVAVDFNAQSLEQRLFESRYNATLKTLFIWQGVSMYLTPTAVDATLSFVVHNSPPGSAIIFDYLYSSVLSGDQKHGEVNGMRRYRFMTGEGLTFAIPKGTVAAFLQERGFSQVIDVGSADLKQLYFTGKNTNRKVVDGYGIATAIV